MNTSLSHTLEKAIKKGSLLEISQQNILAYLNEESAPNAIQSITELIEQEQWEELNDRFFKKLSFGTGGLRGRTIGRHVTKAERGTAEEIACPQNPCAGSNAMNFFNLKRATLGLIRYVKAHLQKNKKTNTPPLLIIAHDTRYFSRDFAEFCAKIAQEQGCGVLLFESPRSTPELSYAIRHYNAHFGIMLTASHNPSHDNGYKVYFEDGGQITEEHAKGIIAEINKDQAQDTPVSSTELQPIESLGASLDEKYIAHLKTLILNPEIISAGKSLRIVFTALHGTGGVLCPRVLRELGFQCDTVAEQDTPNGAFPTVKSPNPENAEALDLAIQQAKKTGADIVIGTDPDADRMGVAVKNAAGDLEIITGNQIGSLLAWYRTKTLFDQGILNEKNRSRSALIKTYVTTPLQDAIAQKFGIHCVNTLTGFKYIGEKLQKYERALPQEKQDNYRTLNETETRDLLLTHSHYFLFGGEESYGYLGTDKVRDKDANGSVVMFAELAAYAQSQNLTIPELLDQIYTEFGYHMENNHSLTFEGATGAEKIQRLARSYSEQPPKEIDGVTVSRVRNFETQDIHDEEGDLLPKAKMLLIDLQDGRSFAVRPSGTEPKIKYYLFGKNTSQDLSQAKKSTQTALKNLWTWIEKDIEQRLAD